MRPALLAALAVAVAGCGDSDPPGDVRVYWEFIRNTAAGEVKYDTETPVLPAGQRDGFCDESGVDWVTITTLSGEAIAFYDDLTGDPYIPCVYEREQGVWVRFIGEGTHTWLVTGWRDIGGSLVAVHEAAIEFDVRSGRTTEVFAELPGIQDDLEVRPDYRNSGNTLSLPGCALGAVSEVGYSFVDGAGTLVADGFAPCTGFVVRLDRDDYALRLQGFPSDLNAPANFDSTVVPACESPTVDHFYPGTATNALTVRLYDVTTAPFVCQ